jgi:hypothetical protein
MRRPFVVTGDGFRPRDHATTPRRDANGDQTDAAHSIRAIIEIANAARR